MKKLLLSFASLAFMAGSLFAQTPPPRTKVTVNGSEAMYPAIVRITNEWKRTNPQSPNIDVTVQGQGSTIGLLNLLEGHCNLAVSTRRITKQEQDEFKSNKVAYKEFFVAKEAVTVVVSPSNPIYKLTNEQVAGIFSGRIKNWKEVGGEDEPIRVFIRSNSSGCYQGFKDMFFKDTADYAPGAIQLSSNAAIKQHMLKYKNGISFLGYNSSVVQDANVKILKIAVDGDNYVAPSQLTIDDGSYKLVRFCYVYTTEKEYDKVKTLIEFMMSAKASDIWEDNGFTSLAPAAPITNK